MILSLGFFQEIPVHVLIYLLERTWPPAVRTEL